MRKTFLKTIGGTALAIFALAAVAQIWVSARETDKTESTRKAFSEGKGARALEGSWSVQMTTRNCQTGAALATFSKMITFMQGGTLQEDSTGSAPLPRASSHGVWKHEGEHNFSYANQFFRFNADGSYLSLIKARWEVEVDHSGDSYMGDAVIEIFNPNGVLIVTQCATETATRFE